MCIGMKIVKLESNLHDIYTPRKGRKSRKAGKLFGSKQLTRENNQAFQNILPLCVYSLG